MDQILELAEQRPIPAPTDGAGGSRLPMAPAASAVSPLIGDLPALLLAVLPLIQAIDWVESASAATLMPFASLSQPEDSAPPAVAVAPLSTEAAIAEALAVIQSPEHHEGSVLVYAADIQPLSLTIDVGDLFSDAGQLSEVTPRFSSASFVANVENDIFGREMNVADTPLSGPDKSDPSGVTNVPIDGLDPTETEGIIVSDGGVPPKGGKGWTDYHPDDPNSGIYVPPVPPQNEGDTFAVVDMAPQPDTKADIVP